MAFRNILFTLITIFSISHAYSQDYLDALTQRTCACIDTIQNIGSEDGQIKLGLCMIQEGMTYKKELKKDHKIDLDHLDSEQGRKLGQLLGLRLASSCQSFSKFVHESNEKNSKNIQEWVGQLKTMEESQFLSFIGVDDEGKTSKFMVLEYFKSFPKYIALDENFGEQKVTISFERRELYDPKLKEFRTYNVIRSIE